MQRDTRFPPSDTLVTADYEDRFPWISLPMIHPIQRFRHERYLSSAFVPVSTMPSWLQWFCQHQPVTPIIETIRGLLTGTPIGGSGLVAVLWCVGILAAAIVWATWMFHRKAGRR